MYPHEVTVWRPRSDGRTIAWENVGAVRCRIDAERPETASTSGDDASWEASVLVPEPCPRPPLQKGDRITAGASDEAEPPKDAMAVVRCDPVSLDAALPQHWEAVAR